MRLGIIRAESRSPLELAAHSRGALDRPLSHDAELWVAVADESALLLGAFQRGRGMPETWALSQVPCR